MTVHPLPDFLVIGAMKSGTNTLYDYLCQHPDVRRSRVHEVHFFDNNHACGLDWYRGHFPPVDAEPRTWLTGETSPYYLFHPSAPRRAAAAVAGAHLVAVLRNPVDRAHSHYQHQRSMGREPLGFEQALDREADRTRDGWADLVAGRVEQAPAVQHFSYLARGRYAEQLARWLEHYPAERLSVVRAEDLYADPLPVLRTLFEAVGLDPFEGLAHRRLNARSYAPAEPELRTRLDDHFRDPVAELAELLGTDPFWEL